MAASPPSRASASETVRGAAGAAAAGAAESGSGAKGGASPEPGPSAAPPTPVTFNRAVELLRGFCGALRGADGEAPKWTLDTTAVEGLYDALEHEVEELLLATNAGRNEKEAVERVMEEVVDTLKMVRKEHAEYAALLQAAEQDAAFFGPNSDHIKALVVEHQARGPDAARDAVEKAGYSQERNVRGLLTRLEGVWDALFALITHEEAIDDVREEFFERRRGAGSVPGGQQKRHREAEKPNKAEDQDKNEDDEAQNEAVSSGS